MIPKTCCSICGLDLIPMQNGTTLVRDIALACPHCDTVCVLSPPMVSTWGACMCAVCIGIQRNLALFSQAVFDPDDTDFPQ